MLRRTVNTHAQSPVKANTSTAALRLRKDSDDDSKPAYGTPHRPERLLPFFRKQQPFSCKQAVWVRKVPKFSARPNFPLNSPYYTCQRKEEKKKGTVKLVTGKLAEWLPGDSLVATESPSVTTLPTV